MHLLFCQIYPYFLSFLLIKCLTFMNCNHKLSQLPFYEVKQIQTSSCPLLKQVLYYPIQQRNFVFSEGETLWKKYFEYWKKTSVASYNSYTTRIYSHRRKLAVLRADTPEYWELKLTHPNKIFTLCDYLKLLNHVDVSDGMLNQILSTL